MSRKNKYANPVSDWIASMDRRDLIEMISQLCEIVTKDAGENGYRGGIRPSNISRDAQGVLSLGEGGMPQRNTWTAEQLEFISPEEFWNGESSARSDVYSLGLLLYYGLSGGKLPFQPDKEKLSAEERAKTVRRRMGGEPIVAPEGAGKSLGSIIEKSLSFRPEDRYTSASDMPVVLQLCLKELDTVHTGKAIEKTEEELSDAENMMVGIISKAAEEAALSDEEKKEAAAAKEGSVQEAETEQGSAEEQDIEVEIVDLDEEAAKEASAENDQPDAEPENETEESGSEVEPVNEEVSEEPAVEEKADKTTEESPEAEEESAETPEEVPEEKTEPVVEDTEEPVPQDKNEEEPPVTEEEVSDKTILVAGATGAAVASAVAAAAAKTAQKEADGVSKAAKTDSKKKAAAATKPAVSYQTGKNTKKPNKKKKKKTLRAVLALLLLCALLVVAAFIINAIAKHRDQTPEETQVPEVTETAAPADTIEPVAPTAEETMEPAPSETELTVYKEDSSWTAAESKCESMGGHLAVIHNQEDLDRIIDLARRNNIRFIWIGCQRMSDGALHWVNGDSIDFYVWADGEPSLIGSGGESENYIMLWNTKEDLSGEWVYNDVGNNPALEYASTYSGRIGYIMETGN